MQTALGPGDLKIGAQKGMMEGSVCLVLVKVIGSSQDNIMNIGYNI